MIRHAKVQTKNRWGNWSSYIEPDKLDDSILEFKNNKEVINFFNSKDDLVYYNGSCYRIVRVIILKQKQVHVKLELTNLREYNLEKLIDNILQ
jgi:hypothetical protein